MNEAAQIEVKLSKSKLRLLMIGAALFFILSIWMIISNAAFSTVNATGIRFTGILAALFFGTAFIFLWRKVTDEKPGLVINQDGVTDNSSGVSAGYIPWSDITEIKLVKVFSQRFLMFIVRNPNEYIAKQTNVIKRKAMELNFKNYGSPISISANTLDCKLDELKHILEERLVEAKTFNR